MAIKISGISVFVYQVFLMNMDAYEMESLDL